MTDHAEIVRLHEIAYRNKGYRMPEWRRAALQLYVEMRQPSSWLDVGCGYAETRSIADEIHIEWAGVEILDQLTGDRVHLGVAQALPFRDNEFELVTCADCIEHIPPDDVQTAIDQMLRVASKCVLLGVPHFKDPVARWKPGEKGDLHLSVHNREWWRQKLGPRARRLLASVTPKSKYTWFELEVED